MGNKIKNITPTNSKGQQHGYWEVHYIGGTLCYKSIFRNGNSVGLYEWYHYNGLSYHKQYFNYNGNVEGIYIKKIGDE